MKTKFVVIAIMAAFLALDFLWRLHENAPMQWLAVFVYVVVLMAASFFETRWVSKQPDQLKARYRVTNISIWIFLLLASISVALNFFIAGELDKTATGMIAIISLGLLGANFARRHELLRELVVREQSHSMNDATVLN